jgi:ATP-dependent DNA helicase RecG
MGGLSGQESQSVEWKWSWQDEFLKWLCGYANTDGGTIYIGVNDDGYVVGLKDSKSLLESLPNKITDKLGILASVRLYTVVQGTNLRYGNDVPRVVAGKLINQYACGLVSTSRCGQEVCGDRTLSKWERENPIWVLDDRKVEYMEVSVPRYPFAISCDGKYYKRSGSTLRELNGFELQSFLLERAGLTWDAVPLPDVTVSDLSKEALEAFRKRAVVKGRMMEAEASVSDEMLLRNLKLFEKDFL